MTRSFEWVRLLTSSFSSFIGCSPDRTQSSSSELAGPSSRAAGVLCALTSQGSARPLREDGCARLHGRRTGSCVRARPAHAIGRTAAGGSYHSSILKLDASRMPAKSSGHGLNFGLALPSVPYGVASSILPGWYGCLPIESDTHDSHPFLSSGRADPPERPQPQCRLRWWGPAHVVHVAALLRIAW